jgi:hypothetical protein
MEAGGNHGKSHFALEFTLYRLCENSETAVSQMRERTPQKLSGPLEGFRN